MSGRRLATAALATLALGGAATGALGAESDERGVLLGLERDATSLERFVQQVSDPDSPRYRKYLSVAQLRARFGARPATVKAARTALSRRGIESRLDATGTFLRTSMTDAQVQATFGTGARLLAREGGDPAEVPTALPADLRGVVTEVVGLDRPAIDPTHSVRHRSIRELRELTGLNLPARTGRAAGCEAGREIPLPAPEVAALFGGTKPFTPNQFRTAFGFDGLHRAGLQGQGMRIALFELDGGVLQRDVEEFARCFGMPVPRVRTVAVGRDEPIPPLEAGPATLEATLDVQSVMTAAPRAAIDIVQGDGAKVTMADVLAAAIDRRQVGALPDVVSISYGQCEAFWDTGGPGEGPAGRRLFDHVARIAGASGISVLVSSGDSGSSGCLHNVGGLPLVDTALPGVLSVSAPSVGYPASSPAVTAVGGTSMVLDRRNRIISQRPWNDTRFGLPALQTTSVEGVPIVEFPTGGGTGGASTFYRQPWYQAASGLRSGRRTVPDVSMYADSAPGIGMYCSAWDPVAEQGPCPPNPLTGTGWNPVGGTSFASPLLAGGVLLADQYAKARGAPPVGFLNPLLYSSRTRRSNVFHDLRRGSNALLPVGCCSAGAGYDKASGWGTVDVSKLARSAQAAWTHRPAG